MVVKLSSLFQLEGVKVKVGNLLQMFLFGGLVISNNFGIVSISPTFISVIETWVAINGIFMAYALFKRPFTTHHVRDVICPQCHTPMLPKNLRCEVCGSTFDLT